ncbi:CAF17-like 4Fe-4S cluster assembly/insertion protein YgfZ [Singulisphaera rosea]
MIESGSGAAIAENARFIDRTDRERLEIGGPDRAKYLHNLSTNDVKALGVGRGQETFVTSPQGKTLGYATLLALEDRILFRTDPGGLDGVLPHLRKYGVFDDVSLEDVRAQTFEFHVSGPKADDILMLSGAQLPEPGDLRHLATRIAERPVRLVRESPSGFPGLTILGALADGPAVSARIHEQGQALGLTELTAETFETLRIEAGTPVSGRDVTAENLPQEVGRDASAISFVKGCYLGQETVARLDALGHVNKSLRGLRIEAKVPPIPSGSTIEVGGKKVGTVTSSAVSSDSQGRVALAYVRVAQADEGTVVEIHTGAEVVSAVVTELPFRKGGGER